MNTVWTIAVHDRIERDGRSDWLEPQIGEFRYGKGKNIPPVFRTIESARKYGDENINSDYTIVEMFFIDE